MLTVTHDHIQLFLLERKTDLRYIYIYIIYMCVRVSLDPRSMGLIFFLRPVFLTFLAVTICASCSTRPIVSTMPTVRTHWKNSDLRGPLFLRREYGVECTVGQPQVNYRETITKKIQFDYLHKKQTGGSGQYARIMGYIEPLPTDTRGKNNELLHFKFENRILGNAIPPEFIPSVEKGKLTDPCTGCPTPPLITLSKV